MGKGKDRNDFDKQGNKKNRVLHIRDSEGIFGTERIILSLGKYVDKDQYSLFLLCLAGKSGRDEEFGKRAEEVGIHVVRLPVKGRIDLRAVLKMRRFLKIYEIALIHSHDFKSNLYGVLASFNLGIRRVTTAHGTTRDSWRKILYLFFDEFIVLKLFDAVITVSKEIAGHLRNRHIKAGRIKIIRNGIDVESFKGESDRSKVRASLETSELENSRKVFGVIGRLFPDKGHRFFIQAFASVLRAEPSVMGIIFGDGPSKEDILKQVRKMNLQNHIELRGVEWDLKGIYGSINYLVVPSVREGLPLVVLEAMVNKIPIVATAVGEIPSVVENELTGYLVKPGDVEGIGKAMMRLMEDPVKVKEMTERAYRLVTERFSAIKMVKENVEVYRSLTVGE